MKLTQKEIVIVIFKSKEKLFRDIPIQGDSVSSKSYSHTTKCFARWPCEDELNDGAERATVVLGKILERLLLALNLPALLIDGQVQGLSSNRCCPGRSLRPTLLIPGIIDMVLCGVIDGILIWKRCSRYPNTASAQSITI